MDFAQTLERVNQMDPGRFLVPVQGKTDEWVCPLCENGTGRNRTGMKVHLHNGKKTLKCFKCGQSGDLLDWLGYAERIPDSDFEAKIRRGAELLGLEQPVKDKNYTPQKSDKEKPMSTGQYDEKVVRETQAYLAKCRERVGECDYFATRGISEEVVRRFGLGYDPAFRCNEGTWQAVVLPTGPAHYEVRNISVGANDGAKSKSRYRKNSTTQIFNSQAFYEDAAPCFVCEGIFDALSIEECGGKAAALGSASNGNLLAALFEQRRPVCPVVLLLDGDAAGKDAAQTLQTMLTEKGVAFVDGCDGMTGWHDANDWLVHDREGLQAFVARMGQTCAAKEDEERQAYLKNSAAGRLDDFWKFAQEMKNKPRYATGIKAIDDTLNGGLRAGLYILGAVSSAGKTTLALQIADHVAQQGTDVLVFTMEQSAHELMAKSISRETYLLCKQEGRDMRLSRSALEILDARLWSTDEEVIALQEKAKEAYGKYANHVFLFEPKHFPFTVAEIKERVEKHRQLTGCRFPLLIIDYLQIIRPQAENLSDKAIVDHNVNELKILSREYDIPVLAISSLNRNSYEVTKARLDMFKESGSIEYSGDVLFALMQGENRAETGSEQDRVRNLTCTFLKNRMGEVRQEGIGLRFHPRTSYFEQNPYEYWE